MECGSCINFITASTMRTDKKVNHINIPVTLGPSIHELLFSEVSKLKVSSTIAADVD